MSVAKSYAKALFETAKETGQSVETVENELNAFSSAVEQGRDVRIALQGPVTTAKEKMQAVEAVAQKMGLGELTRRFLLLLAKKERLALLSGICLALSEVRLAAGGGVSGKLVSAEPMSAADKDSLAAAFSKKLGKKVDFRFEEDPTLLAGVKVTVSGVTYDGTLRSQLQRLRDQVAAGASH